MSLFLTFLALTVVVTGYSVYSVLKHRRRTAQPKEGVTLFHSVWFYHEGVKIRLAVSIFAEAMHNLVSFSDVAIGTAFADWANKYAYLPFWEQNIYQMLVNRIILTLSVDSARHVGKRII